jgi:hypothetical protein
MLNLPDKNARRDIVHGVKHLEEIAEGWLCARRTLGILSMLARRWKYDLPEEAAAVLARTDSRFGRYASEAPSPRQASDHNANGSHFVAPQTWPAQSQMVPTTYDLTTFPTGSNAISHATPVVPSPAYQYPTAQSTPQQPPAGALPFRKPASPSAFGGVEQLIRDSHDWVVRDQSQLATGFENWTRLDMDPTMWMNGAVANTLSHAVPGAVPVSLPVNGGSMNGGTANGGTVPTAMRASMPTTGAQMPQYAAGMNGYPIMDWTNGGQLGGYDNMVTYNTDDWYDV